MKKEKEHPVTWEQIEGFFVWAMFGALFVLAVWKVWDLIVPPWNPCPMGYTPQWVAPPCDVYGDCIGTTTLPRQ